MTSLQTFSYTQVPKPPQILSCVHSTGHNNAPIVFIFGMGIGWGKIPTPVLRGFGPTCGAIMGKNGAKCLFSGHFLVCTPQILTDSFDIEYGHWLG